MTVETDLQKILAADVLPYVQAHDAALRARGKEDEEHSAATALVKPAHDRMRAAIVKALRPHNVEWTLYSPLTINWTDNVTIATFDGNVWPAPKARKGFTLPARPHVRFSFTPRDADEFHRVVAMLKAMADAATAGGL
jgi:hypothetical protein